MTRELPGLSVGITSVILVLGGCGPSAPKSTSTGSTPDAGGTTGPDGGAPPGLDGGTPTSAPAIDLTVPTSFSAVTQFIYRGPNPIQVGVAPGTINPQFVVVLRGFVRTRDGVPAVGALVSVVGHSEYGFTQTKSDGWFSIAANGGGLLKVSISKSGYLAVQRQAVTPWQDWVILDDSVLTALDPVVTLITPGNAQLQIARGSMVSDSDGQRQATLLFPAGTTAAATLPDGGTQTLAQLHVRATEYTVGSDGPKAMPAALPPTSGYTYAVELSIDEAEALEASAVEFTNPVAAYVDNFVGIPVGEHVPVGFYDRPNGVWKASTDGRVVSILSVTNGLANLDVTGAGVASQADALAALGITNDERTALGSLYPSGGKTLWRALVPHFSPWDLNYPAHAPDDAIYPPDVQPVSDDNPDPDPCDDSGSIIECENQTLGESLPIAGTPFSLFYRSDVASPLFGGTHFVLTGATIPPSLQGVQVVVTGAGRVFTQTFPAQASLQYAFQWDGKDAFGRVLNGKQQFILTVTYFYQAVDGIPAFPPPLEGGASADAGLGDAGASFGSLASGFYTVRGRKLFEYSRSYKILTGRFIPPALEFGHWTLNVQHRYQPDTNILYRGDGVRQEPFALRSGAQLVAGGGTSAVAEGVLATTVNLQPANRLPIFTAAPDGSLYILISERNIAGSYLVNRLWRVGLDGKMTLAAGYDNASIVRVQDILAHYQDDVPATESTLQVVTSLTSGSDGNLYLAETGLLDHVTVVRRIGQDGVISRFAGSRSATASAATNIPATDAILDPTPGMATDAWGNLFIADDLANTVLRVDSRGVLSTYAFNGIGSPRPDGDTLFTNENQPAVLGSMPHPNYLTVARDGTVYVSAGLSQIVRVGPDGIASTFAPGLADPNYPDTVCTLGYCGVGWPSATPNGDVVFGVAPTLYPVIRRADSAGNVTALSAILPGQCIPSGAPAAATCVGQLYGVATGPLGEVYVGADLGNKILRFATKTFENSIPSRDGSEIFLFDSSGRHLSTLNALTGATKWSFAYDANGLLSSIQDGDGNVTTLQRDGSGDLLSIQSPFGQKTTVTFDTNGNLSQVVDPLGNSTSLTSAGNSLLTQLTDGRGHTHTFQYDSNGRLTKDTDPAGGFLQFTRQPLTGQDYTVTKTSALSRTTSYALTFPGQDRARVTQYPDALVRTERFGADGTVTVSLPDGTAFSSHYGPSPLLGMQAPVLLTRTTQTPSGLTYSESHSTVATTPPGASNPYALSTLEVDSVVNGRPSSSIYTAAAGTITETSPAGRVTTSLVDGQGRLLQRSIAGLLPVVLTYDRQGRLATVAQGSRVTIYTYDASSGYLASKTDSLGQVTSFQRDALGRPTLVVLPGTRSVATAFDANSNVTSVTPPVSPAHSLAYSTTDELSSYSPPGVTSPPASPIAQSSTSYAYDLDQAPIQISSPSGATTVSSYDSAGRLATVQTSRHTVTFGYSAATGQLNMLADSTATGPSPSGSSLSIASDGPFETAVGWTGAITGSITYAYNSDFLVSGTTVQGMPSVAYTYDPDLLLISAGIAGSAPLNLTRDSSNGLLTGTTVAATATTYAYSGYAELESATALAAASSLYSESIARDNAGRIVGKTESVLGAASVDTYTYDQAGRLTDVTVNGSAVGHWTYDTNGNRLSETTVSGTVHGTYDAQDRLITYGLNSYTFGPNGDLQQKTGPAGPTVYAYDVQGSLVSVVTPSGNQISYILDAVGTRVGKKVNGTLVRGWLYDHLRPVAELDGTGTVVSLFVYATHSQVPDLMWNAGVLYRLVADERGSVRLVVNASTGAVAERLDYDAWGNVTLDTNPGFQPFGFAGGLWDQETGLVRFGTRDYDPSVGRWTNKDPLRFQGGDTNLYVYVLNDPINGIDPLGLSASSLAGCFGKGLVAGAIGTLAVVAIGAAAAAVLPVAAVTTLAFAAALAGAITLGIDVGRAIDYGNFDRLAYDAGALVGSAVTGGISGRAAAEAFNGEPSPPWSWDSDKAQLFNPDLGNNLWTWMGTGLSPGSAAYATAAAGTGAAVAVGGDACGCN